ncbi:MAG: hypothetical protein GXO10_05325 [Crenarchaeota archaeon]|nr:hypothetical protein [Thermoproteota archaeon]
MCVEDVVSEFSRGSSKFDKLGVFYGTLVLYVVFRRFENIVAGPLHMASVMVLDLFRDVFSIEELETFRCGIARSVVIFMKCPAFHNKSTRVFVLKQSVKRLALSGVRLYISILRDRANMDKFREIVESCSIDDLVGVVDFHELSSLGVGVDEAARVYGLLASGSRVYVPVPDVLLRELDRLL